MTCALVRCAVAVLLMAVGSMATDPENNYVTQKDFDVAADSNRAVGEFCQGEFRGRVDAQQAREDLTAAMGGDNFILHAMTNATTFDEVIDNLREEYSPLWFIPIISGVIVLIMFAFCCWTWFPCARFCRCCRCFQRERKTSLLLKICAALLVLTVLIGIIASVWYADHGYRGLRDGVANAACTSSQMLNTTLAGKTDHPHFIGMIPVLNSFYDLERNLDDGTPFMTNLSAILNRTFDVSKSMTLASETLNLLESMMENAQNKNPRNTLGDSMMHQCDFCTQIAEPLGPAVVSLQNGVGAALSDARAEVDSQLTPEKRRDLQQTLASGTAPMIQFKDSFRDSMAVFVQPGGYDQFRDAAAREARAAVLVLFLFAFMLFCCGCCSASCFLFRERRGKEGDNVRTNPYTKSTHRLACCSWWCGFIYAFMALLFGGLLMAISIPASAGCLAMDDLNRGMIEDLAPLLGLNLTGDQGEMTLDLVDHCINPANRSENANFLDMIYERNQTTGEKTTLRHNMITTVTAPIDASFGTITDRMNTSSGGLANSESFLNLREALRLNNVSSMLVAVRAEMVADPTLQPMELDTRDDGISVGFSTSAACLNHTVNGSLGSLTGQLIPGIENFVGAFEAYGPLVDASFTCASARVVCAGNTGNALSVCNAGNAYLTLKEQLVTAVQFRCDLFEDPADASLYCDPLNMVRNSGVWEGDCVKADGTLTVKERFCTLAEFDTYVRGYDERIKLVMERLDTVVAEKSDTIVVDLQGLVDRFIIAPIQEVADGITCGWLPQYYQALIDGLCFQGVWGARKIGQAYVLSGAFVVLLVFVMYAVWRRAIDNVNMWTADAEASRVNV